MNKSTIKRILKQTLLKTLDALPSKVGFDLYHKIQNRLTDNFEVKYLANSKSYEDVVRILKQQNKNLENKAILEIGSGWMPLMPYQLKVDGDCSKVFTYDINDHYSNVYIDQLNARYKKENRLNFELEKEGLHLPSFIEYHPYSNVISAELPKKIDVVFSRFVLEHVTPEDMLAMHKRFAETYGKDVLILHLISPSDHRSFSDSSISHYDFLRYSEKEWNRIQTKFDYHNRLRLPQYLQLFEEAGMEVLYIEHDHAKKGSKKYELFQKLKIHEDFAHFSHEELTAGSINVLLRPKKR